LQNIYLTFLYPFSPDIPSKVTSKSHFAVRRLRRRCGYEHPCLRLRSASSAYRRFSEVPPLINGFVPIGIQPLQRQI